jgi:hypothetical protein
MGGAKRRVGNVTDATGYIKRAGRSVMDTASDTDTGGTTPIDTGSPPADTDAPVDGDSLASDGLTAAELAGDPGGSSCSFAPTVAGLWWVGALAVIGLVRGRVSAR